MYKLSATVRTALSISDPECLLIIKHPTKRRWRAYTTGLEWRCTSNTKQDAIKWGTYSQAECRRIFTKNVHAYCGRTGKRLA